MAPQSPYDGQRQRLLIVGSGMAALKLVEELISQCPGRFDITLIGREPHPPYNRVLLSSLLVDEAQPADLELKPKSWFADHGVEVLSGTAVTALHPETRQVSLASGRRLSYDRLVLATGSSAVVLPISGNTLPGVITFRDIADVEALQRAQAGSRAVVIGGGLLGIEAAYGLAKRGVAVTLIHLMSRLMERQLDERSALLLKSALEQKGIDVVLQAQAAGIAGDGTVERVTLKDGRVFPASLVVMAVGIRPETALARSCGLETGRGIKVDDHLATSAPGIYAIGECAEHRGTCYGIVDPAYEQARILASHVAGKPASYGGSLLATSLKVSGVPVYSMGDFEGDGADVITLEDEAAGAYRKLVVRDDRLAGVVLFGDTSDAFWYRELMSCATPLIGLRPVLAFGKAYAEAASS